VLVHSATGGVGLAAIRLAQWKGAEVLATAGSPQKRALLALMGVRHVVDSRRLDFIDEFRAATGGRGVDVVLNTLAGKAAEANWELLAPYGRYVELAKRDILTAGQLALTPFARNLSFHAVDIADMVVTRPERAGTLLHKIVDLVRRGDLGPLPFSRYSAERAADALHELAEARQVGKVVLSFNDGAQDSAGDRSVAAAPRAARAPLAGASVGATFQARQDASYLVTGGLGDLGRVVTSWLIDRGARHVVLVGRTVLPAEETWDALASNEPRAAGVAALRAWRTRGAEVDYHALDVADDAALSAALAGRRAAGLPGVRGVVHAAGVIRYQPVMDLDAQGLAEVLRPKVAGARCLDRVLADEPLDFFVLFSSGSAVLSSPMLGSYAAANAAMDAVAHHRRAHGRTALSVNWGFWGSVGMAARFEHEQGRPLAPQGMASFSPAEGVAVLERLLGIDTAQVLVMRADWSTWAHAYPEAASVPILRRLCALPRAESPQPPPDVAATAFMPAPPAMSPAAAPPTSQPARPAAAPDPTSGAEENVASYVAERVAAVLRKPVARLPRRQALNRLGLDSLMAVEVRNCIQRDLGVNVPVVKLLGGNTLSDLIAEVEGAGLDVAGDNTHAEAGFEVVEL
jgi:NADPH:quinone reductase-like Zn-dependent oxidoreductase/acyl carrier protein